MEYFQPNPGTTSSPTFGAWVTQWRLSILGLNSVKPVLACILDWARSSSSQHQEVGRLLAQFFLSLENSSSAPSSPLKCAEVSQLLARAGNLPASQAKRLLEHLSRSYTFEDSGRPFWMIAAHALETNDSSVAAMPPVRPI
jgi:hypothetical protein